MIVLLWFFLTLSVGNVRIRYQEVGAGFPLLVTPGGGLNSRISNWATAVFNAPETFKNDFRCAQTGNPLSPSYYLIFTALLSLIALIAIQRRSRRPMQAQAL